MSLSERNRSVLFEGLVRTIGDEEAVSDLMAQFPAGALDRPATRGDIAELRGELHAEVAGVRVEMAELRSEMRTEFASVRSETAELRSEVRTEFASVRGEMAELRSEMRTEFASVGGEMAELRSEMRTEFVSVRGETAELGTEMRTELASVREGLADCARRSDLEALTRRVEQGFAWMFGVMVAMFVGTLGAIVALAVALT